MKMRKKKKIKKIITENNNEIKYEARIRDVNYLPVNIIRLKVSTIFV